MAFHRSRILGGVLGIAVVVATAAQPAPPAGSGPYPALREEDPRLPGFTLYRPRDLATAGKLPLVV